MTRAIVMDVEGTTTSVTFVHDVLFPLSRERMASFVAAHASEPRVRAALEATKATVLGETDQELDDAGACDALARWIGADRKHPALKELQGMIWRVAYEAGEITSHVYDDVPRALRRWRERGLRLAVFSSGSIEAQRQLFAHAQCGNLAPLLDRHFDAATTGPKREAESYRSIARGLELDPADVLYLSDTEEELHAARVGGMETTRLARGGEPVVSLHPVVASFDEVMA